MGVSLAGQADAGSKEADWRRNRFVVGRRSVAAAVRADRNGWRSRSVVSGGRLELGGLPWSYPLGIAGAWRAYDGCYSRPRGTV